MKKILFIFCYTLIAFLLKAQEATVAYKTDTWNYGATKNLKLKTNCEMADLVITKIGGDKIIIKCTYSAKHVDKSIAVKDLSKHNVRVKKTLNEIFISNYFTTNNNDKEPKAKLNIKFEILLPNDVVLDVQNNFGSISMKDLSLKGNLVQDYGKVDLKNASGNLEIKGKLSNINILHFNGSLEIRNKSGDVAVEDIAGSLLFIQNSNANIKLKDIANSVNIKLQLTNCDLTCKKINYNQHGMSIQSYKEAIMQQLGFVMQNKKDVYTITNNKALPGFIIQAEYTKINLQ